MNAPSRSNRSIDERGSLSLEAEIASKVREVPAKLVVTETNKGMITLYFLQAQLRLLVDLLQDMLASLRQKAQEFEKDKWMYEDNTKSM
ncbi:unnamed protein product [Aphanomyces euteiches]|uniref:Uncharacterized protein n=1 Tax=Aphanomyces euteiches TaxID=100861 RepID=A0A6G0WCJ7_9STRA|nr:hypothetical protein Ae201684_016419 [Aphanomyces euteiches]KAH9082627.1 hypothetical protein Ae201684P_009950 [Aphanomyces euteiches]KAH9156756.1 hypothetical protein AeRB84_001351 [Aphanomyces euteiches]